MGSPELVQEVVHVRERVEVMDHHFIERPKVDAEAEGAIILLDRVGFRNPITGGRNDNTFGEHIGDDSINVIVVEGGTSACSHADGSGIPGMNDMLYWERDSSRMRGLEGY